MVFLFLGIGLQHLEVTALGPDRSGIVARLSKRVLDCGANVEINRFSLLDKRVHAIGQYDHLH